jgi:hypothetical protein
MARRTSRTRQQGPQGSGAITPDEIRALQLRVAQSLIHGERVPGGADRVQFPDARFFAERGDTPVSDEHLAGPTRSRTAANSGASVRVLAEDEILQTARDHGDLPYLTFAPPVVEGSTLTLTVHGRVAPADPQQRPGHLSSATFRFERRGDAWALIEGPTYSAA